MMLRIRTRWLSSLALPAAILIVLAAKRAERLDSVPAIGVDPCYFNGDRYVGPAIISGTKIQPLKAYLTDLESKGTGLGAFGILKLIENIADKPEYHDCQRLRVGGWLSAFKDHYGPKANVLYVLLKDSQDLPSDGTAQLRATILSDGDYGDLHIDKSNNDVPSNGIYLYRSMGRIGAFIISCRDCKATMAVSERQGPSVQRLFTKVTGGYAAGDIPSAAKWEWDTKHSKNYVGLRCGETLWCEVAADADFVSAPMPTPPPGTSEADLKRYQAKGWYDRQTLAVFKNNSFELTEITGIIVPTESATRQDQKDFVGTWIDMATVFVEGDTDSKYYLKLGLGQSPNKLALCYGLTTNCGISQNNTPTGCSQTVEPRWWARITSGLGDQSYHCVAWMDHGNDPIPGTARWAWVDTDDLLWVHCPQGCCRVS